MKTRNQEVAQYALNCVKSLKDFQDKYKSYIKSFPALLISEGLILALAFTLSKSDKNGKGERARSYVFDHVVTWLKRSGVISTDLNGEISKEIAEKIVEEISNMEFERYRLASLEALRVSDWLRRFAEALIEGEE